MGANLSTSNKQTCPLTPDVVADIKQSVQDHDSKRLKQLLQGCTRKDCRSLSTLPEMGSYIHVAIVHRNKDLLKLLVHHCGIPVEERDRSGMTPLYNAVFYQWPEGALILLDHGANVQKAEVPVWNPLHQHAPLFHLAVRTRNENLILELLERGVNIGARDSEGYDCLDVCRSDSHCKTRRVLFQYALTKLENQPSTQPVLDKDLYFLIRFGSMCSENYLEVDKFIKKQQLCSQRRLFQFLAACCAMKDDYKRALQYWRIAVQRKPCLLHHNKDADSVFADILSVDELLLLKGETFPLERKHYFDIKVLFVIEQCIPDDRLLVDAALRVTEKMVLSGELATAVSILRCLVYFRALYNTEIISITNHLNFTLHKLQNTSDVPFEALLNSMEILCKILSLLSEKCSIHSPEQCPCSLCSSMYSQLNHVLRTLNIFYEKKVAATLEQLRSFCALTKRFISTFSRACGPSLFHRVGALAKQFPCIASVIFTLVACSVNVHGSVGDQNSPLHLCPDRQGDTPLHVFARLLSPQDLMEGGVLECLLDQGASVCAKNKKLESVHDILVQRGVITNEDFLPKTSCCFPLGACRVHIECEKPLPMNSHTVYAGPIGKTFLKANRSLRYTDF